MKNHRINNLTDEKEPDIFRAFFMDLHKIKTTPIYSKEAHRALLREMVNHIYGPPPPSYWMRVLRENAKLYQSILMWLVSMYFVALSLALLILTILCKIKK